MSRKHLLADISAILKSIGLTQNSTKQPFTFQSNVRYSSTLLPEKMITLTSLSTHHKEVCRLLLCIRRQAEQRLRSSPIQLWMPPTLSIRSTWLFVADKNYLNITER